ncbi:MAG: hypothetical protein KIT22_07965 [Verrucomicrobiae bacterium]|nr:hypothetical protein [Verrucomicrobiae bacterium]
MALPSPMGTVRVIMHSAFIIRVVWWVLVTAGVLVAHYVFAVGWGVSLGGVAVILAGVFANGLLLTWEDEWSGGFNNPTPEQTGKDSHDDNAV